MDPKMKTVLAVVAGVVLGVTLLGGVFAAHAVMGTVAFASRATDRGYGMMGQRQGFDDGRGMMGPRGDRFGAPEAFDGGACQGAGPGAGQGMMGQGGCQGGPQGMMGQGGCQGGPQGDTGACPNGEACPGVTDAPATES